MFPGMHASVVQHEWRRLDSLGCSFAGRRFWRSTGRTSCCSARMWEINILYIDVFWMTGDGIRQTSQTTIHAKHSRSKQENNRELIVIVDPLQSVSNILDWNDKPEWKLSNSLRSISAHLHKLIPSHFLAGNSTQPYLARQLSKLEFR